MTTFKCNGSLSPSTARVYILTEETVVLMRWLIFNHFCDHENAMEYPRGN